MFEKFLGEQAHYVPFAFNGNFPFVELRIIWVCAGCRQVVDVGRQFIVELVSK